MVEHIVLIKCAETTTAAQKQQLIDRTLRLKETIPGIVDIQQGLNFSTRNKGYDIGLTVRFENREALQNYLPHPDHQATIAYLQQIGVEDTIIVDFDIN